jgi:hypothetical protein
MFEKASRGKFKYPHKGQIATEDLWDLTVENLDTIYKDLKSEQNKQKQESLLTVNKENDILNLKIEIIKHIVEIKQLEKIARNNALAKKQQISKIKEIIAQKQDKNLADKPIDELEALVKTLE